MIAHFNDGCRRVRIVSNLSAEGPGFNPRSRERHTKDDKNVTSSFLCVYMKV